MLDPDLMPEGLFRPGLSPYSDLVVCHDGATGRVTVEALLAPGADYRRTQPLPGQDRGPVGPSNPGPGDLHREHRVPSARAELRLPFPLDEVHESWIEVVRDKHWPVLSAKGHLIRRALRWADAALRAERAPAGLAPESTHEDWAALAAAAWERCRHDWEAAGDADHAYLAAVAPGRPERESADLRPAAALAHRRGNRPAKRQSRAPATWPKPSAADAKGPGADLCVAPGAAVKERSKTRCQHGLRTRRTPLRSPPAPAGSPPTPLNQPGRSRRDPR